MTTDLPLTTRELPPQAWQALLQEGLPGFGEGSLAIESLALTKLRRSSSRRRHPHPLTVCVDLQVVDTATGRRGVQRLYGKAYREGASAAAWQDANRQDWVTPAYGAALAHLPAHDMLWWAWPNDPGLPQLPGLLNPAQHAAGQAVAQVQAIRYEPEDRATLRCTLADGRTIYGKTFADDRSATVMARFTRAWDSAQQDPLAALVAEPLHHDAATHTVWQAAASGLPLLSLPDAALPAALHRLGQALARVHELPLAGTSDHSLAHWLTEAGRRANKIGRVAPELGARVQVLLQGLQQQALPLATVPLSLVHGDFHPDQVWVHDGRPLLFDFDEFAQGQPMEDLAAFITRLRQQPLPPARLAAAEDALCSGYRHAAPQRWHGASLRWHLALQALLQASRAFVFQVPGWPEVLAQRLTVAERCTQALTENAA